MRVLLIDSDIESISKMRSEMSNHYVLDVAHNAEEGIYLSQVNDYSAIVIEDTLLDVAGPEVCKQTREYDQETPILMLLDQNDLELKISTLECGADAVLTKPVQSREVKAYIRMLIKRAAASTGTPSLSAGDLTLDMRTKKVMRGGKQIQLRKKEYALLEYLLLNKNNVVSKETLLENVWDAGLLTFSNTLEVHIKTLRDKVDKPFKTKLIKTVHGFGYKLVDTK